MIHCEPQASTGEQVPAPSAIDVILQLERTAARSFGRQSGSGVDELVKLYFQDVQAVLDTVEELHTRLPPGLVQHPEAIAPALGPRKLWRAAHQAVQTVDPQVAGGICPPAADQAAQTSPRPRPTVDQGSSPRRIDLKDQLTSPRRPETKDQATSPRRVEAVDKGTSARVVAMQDSSVDAMTPRGPLLADLQPVSQDKDMQTSRPVTPKRTFEMQSLLAAIAAAKPADPARDAVPSDASEVKVSVLPLFDSFRGRAPPLSDGERRAVHDATIHWDLAIVLPNPDWNAADRKDVHDCHDVCDSCCQCDSRCRRYVLHSILWALEQAFTWTAPDMSKPCGISEKDAQDLYNQALRGVNPDPEMERAFMEAFHGLKEFHGHDPPLFLHGAGAQPHEQRKRVSQGGAFRRCTAPETWSSSGSDRSTVGPSTPSFGATSQVLRPSQAHIETSANLTSRTCSSATYVQTRDPDRTCTDFLSLLRNVLVTKLSRIGLSVELVFSADFRYIYALVGASPETLLRLAQELRYPFTVDLVRADPDAFEPCDQQYRLYEEGFLLAGSKKPSLEELYRTVAMKRASSTKSASSIATGFGMFDVSGEAAARRAHYARYLECRLHNMGAVSAMKVVNSERSKLRWRSRFRQKLRCVWEMLGMQPVLGVRAACGTSKEAEPLPWKKYSAVTVSGSGCPTYFSHIDRLQLMVQAITREIDVIFLSKRGFVVDILPIPPDAAEPVDAQHGASLAGSIGGASGHGFDLESGSRRSWCQKRGRVEGADDPVGANGQAMGIYFAFVRHLSWSLTAVAGFGLCIQILGAVWPAYIAELLLANALFLSVWATFWLSRWRHVQDRLLLQWGVLRCDRGRFFIKPANMQFSGKMKRSPVTGRDEESHPFSSNRHVCYAFSIVLSGVFSIGQLLLVCYFCALRAKIHRHTRLALIGYNFSSHVVTIMNALSIIILNPLLRKLALFLTALENHRSHTSFVDHYTIKAIILQLVNTYASLFYIAFFTEFAEQNIASGTLALCPEDLQGVSAGLNRLLWNVSETNCVWVLLNREHVTLLAIFLLKNVFELGVPWFQRHLAGRLRTSHGHFKALASSSTVKPGKTNKRFRSGGAVLDLGVAASTPTTASAATSSNADAAGADVDRGAGVGCLEISAGSDSVATLGVSGSHRKGEDDACCDRGESGRVAAGSLPGSSASTFPRIPHIIEVLDEMMLVPRFGGPEYATNGPLEDYTELTVMLGFLLLFSITFPLSSLFVLICCFLESYVDEFKVQRLVRKPLPVAATSIGIWDPIFECLVAASVATNAALLVWTARLAHYNFVQRLLGEHFSGSFLVPWAILCLLFGTARLLTQVLTRRRPAALEAVDQRMARSVERHMGPGGGHTIGHSAAHLEGSAPVRNTDMQVRPPWELLVKPGK